MTVSYSFCKAEMRAPPPPVLVALRTEWIRLSRKQRVLLREQIKTWETGGRHLEDDFLMYGKFGNDVCQQQVSTVFASGIHTSFGE